MKDSIVFLENQKTKSCTGLSLLTEVSFQALSRGRRNQEESREIHGMNRWSRKSTREATVTRNFRKKKNIGDLKAALRMVYICRWSVSSLTGN